MLDIVRRLTEMDNALVHVEKEINTLRNQLGEMSRNIRSQAKMTTPFQNETEKQDKRNNSEPRRTSYGSSYRQETWRPASSIANSQGSIQESWLVGGQLEGVQAQASTNVNMEHAVGTAASPMETTYTYARQSEYSIYARP